MYPRDPRPESTTPPTTATTGRETSARRPARRAARRLALLAGAVLLVVGALAAAGVDAAAQAASTAIAQAAAACESALPWAWVAFGFAGQAAFSARFLVQWLASERAQDAVVPAAFWFLSIVGGTMLFIYFYRRRDPVGMAGQALGLAIYLRNVVLLTRARNRRASAPIDSDLPTTVDRPAPVPTGMEPELKRAPIGPPSPGHAPDEHATAARRSSADVGGAPR